MKWQNSDPLTSIGLNLTHFALEGTYVSSGWGASIGSSGTAIEIDVNAGDGYIENSAVSTTSGIVTLSDGDAEYPRRDIIYVASDGTFQSSEGKPRPASEDRDGNALGPENAPVPEPNSGDGLAGIPIWYVWVPAGATDTSDLEPHYLYDLRQDVDIAADGSSSGDSAERLSISPTALDAGEHIDAPLTVLDGDTIRVTEWGASEYNAGEKTNPPTGVRVALATPGGAIVTSEETPLTRDSDGIVTESVSGTGAQHYSMRLINDSGTDYSWENNEGLAAQFKVLIE